MTDCVMGEQKLLSELRVTELKQELEKRNLDKNGIKIILTDRLEKALIADGHDPATYLFRVNETVASPGSVKPTSPTISPAASMENLADGNEEKKEEHTSENGNGTGTAAGEAHDEPMESESATPAKDGGAENADNLDTSKELVIVDEPAADAAAPAADEEMLEDPLIDVPTETSAPAAAAAAKPAVTVTTSSAVKTPVQAPANDDKEKDTASRSIWVRGLTSATKAADLKVLCTQFGKVVRAKIYTSKKQTTSACYGYVTMADTAAAEKAATALHKTQYKGRTISVEKADRSKVPAVKSASAAAAPTKKDAAGDSTASAKRGESEKKTSDETSKSAKSASMAGEKSQSESKGGKRAGSTTSTTQSKRDDSRSDRKRDDKDARRSSNSERRDSERPLKSSDSKREPFRRAPARDPRRDSQRTITAARRFPATSTRGLPSRSLRGRITRPGDRTSSYLSMRRPEAMTQRDLLSLMRRKEEEHRRREAEIEKERALERERERIRFEREQLEKERLQLQLQAALQQQKLAAMSSSRTKDTYLPSSVRGSSRGRHSDYRDSRDSRGDKLSSSVHRRSAGDSRRPAADDRSRSRHVGGGDRSGASRIDRDRSEHKPSAASSRDRSRHESYGSSRGHSSSQPAAYSRKDYDRGYTSSRDTTSYGGRGGSSYYGNSRDAYSSSATSRIGGSSGGWGSSSGAGYGSSAWEGGSGSAVGHSSSGSAWGGRGAAGSNGWSTFGSGGGTSSSSSMRYDYDKYQQRF